MLNIQTMKRPTPIVVRTWANAIVAAGGGFTNSSRSIATTLINALQTRSYYSRIKYLLPMLGNGINAARVPLIDAANYGLATNVNFVDGDFSESLGLTGNGSSKYFNIPVTPLNLGSSTGGMGFWNMFTITGGDYKAGTTNGDETIRCVLDFRATVHYFSWGSIFNAPTELGVTPAAHYYGQQSAITNRILCENGVQIASNTTSDATSPLNTNIFLLAGNVDGSPISQSNATCGLFYLTDGTLTSDEVADFDFILRMCLMTPSGKI